MDTVPVTLVQRSNPTREAMLTSRMSTTHPPARHENEPAVSAWPENATMPTSKTGLGIEALRLVHSLRGGVWFFCFFLV